MLLAHRPGAILAPYVETLWYYDGCRTVYQRERVLPSGRFQIVMDLSTGRGTIAGMRSQYIEIESAAIPSVMGVVFRAGGARAVCDGPAIDFYNRVIPLDAVWGAKTAPLCDRLRDTVTPRQKFHVLEAALLRVIREGAEQRRVLHPSVQYALRAFWHVPHVRSVIEVSKEAGLSRRRFSQLFGDQIGMTPKRYCRLIRFRDVVRTIAKGARVDWTDIALAGGYYDQAHLAHEFRAFSGMCPSRFLTAERPFVNHIRID